MLGTEKTEPSARPLGAQDAPQGDQLVSDLADVLAGHDVIILMVEPADGSIVAANRAAEVFYGRPQDQLTALKLDEFCQDPGTAAALTLADARSGLVKSWRDSHRRADGILRRVEVHASPVTIAGRVLLLSMIFDITEREAEAAELAASRRHYRLLAENSSDFVMEVSTQGEILWISPSVGSVLGWTPQQLIGSPVRDLVHPHGHQELLAAAALVNAGGSTTGRTRMRHADGSYRWLSHTARPLVDEDGTTISRVSGWSDITEMVRTEQGLRESRERFRMLAENSSDVVMQSTLEGVISWVSPAVTRVLGWAPEELVGRDFATVVHPEDLTATIGPRAALFEDDDFRAPAGGYVVRLLRKDGNYLWMSGVGVPMFDESGTPVGAVGGLHDVDALVRAKAVALQGQQRLAATMDSLIDPHVLVTVKHDSDGAIVDFIHEEVNQAAATFLGMPASEVVGTPFMSTSDPKAREGFIQWYNKSTTTGSPLVLNDFLLPGTDIRLDVRGVRVGDLISFTWRDVTDRYLAAEALAESEKRYRMLAEHSSDVVFRTDAQGTIEYISPAVQELLGWPPEDFLGRPLLERVHPEDQSAVVGAFPALAERMGLGNAEHPGSLAAEAAMLPATLEIRHLTARGEYIWMSATARLVFDDSGELLGLIGRNRDIDEAHRNRVELQFLASHDPLTKLANRTELLRRLDRVLSHRPRRGARPAVLFCDVDDLKAVNDTHGHGAGDAAIVHIANRIRDQLRDEDIVSRIGGDEFVVALTNAGTTTEAEIVARKIHEAISEPLRHEGAEIPLSLSIGIALASDTDDPESLLRRADHAVYVAKRGGRNQTVGPDFLRVAPDPALREPVGHLTVEA